MEHRMDYGFTCSGGECDILFVTLMSGVPLDLFISQKTSALNQGAHSHTQPTALHRSFL